MEPENKIVPPAEVPEHIKKMGDRLNKLDAFLDQMLKDEKDITLKEVIEMLLIKSRHLTFAYNSTADLTSCLGWMSLVLYTNAEAMYNAVKSFHAQTLKNAEDAKCQNNHNGEPSTSESMCSRGTESKASQDMTSTSASTETPSASSNTIQEETKS
jgi:hypothetical protein